YSSVFLFTDPAPPHTSPLSLHDALPISARLLGAQRATGLTNAVLRRFIAERASLLARVDALLPARTAHPAWLVEQIAAAWPGVRSEEHTSELQSQSNLVCRLLLEKKKKK